MDIKRLLRVVSARDAHSSLFWDDDLNFFILCNDCFAYAAADAVAIENDHDILLLEYAYENSPENGDLLYCARKRQKTPLASAMKYVQESEKHLFIFGAEI